MTIRLTSPEAFDRVLEKLKENEFWDEEYNEWFFKYDAVGEVKKEMAKGEEIYLDAEWIQDPRGKKIIVLAIRYHKRSDIMTDEEYLKEEDK